MTSLKCTTRESSVRFKPDYFLSEEFDFSLVNALSFQTFSFFFFKKLFKRYRNVP